MNRFRKSLPPASSVLLAPTVPLLALLAAIVLLSVAPVSASTGPQGPEAGTVERQQAVLGDYIVLGWNDLGMHCANRYFADLCVLPPYNTFWAVILKRGDALHAPQLESTGYSVSYAIEDNTYSVGKTDFWTYVQQLFGVQLPDNIGLAGKGLSGDLDVSGDHFQAVGVPLTPYLDSDLLHEQPYQLGDLTALDPGGTPIATTQIVVPISNEMTCNACHIPQAGETVEHSILRMHDQEEGTNLVAQRPILCATCHGSNALGMPGNPNLPSLSLAMHGQHAEVTDNCYNCHPGPNTQCLRDVMSQRFGLTCQTCHGHVSDVASSIEAGRQPWLQEPRCQTCHGDQFAEMPNTLYRNSNNGHGGLYCEACHNSPHAILPSREERDNRQNVALQGFAGTLSQCDVCHGVVPAGPGPHGLFPSGLREAGSSGAFLARVAARPNPAAGRVEIDYRVVDRRPLRLAIHDVSGRTVRILTSRPQTPGDHTLVWDGTDQDSRPVVSGVYYCRLETGGQVASVRLVRIE